MMSAIVNNLSNIGDKPRRERMKTMLMSPGAGATLLVWTCFLARRVARLFGIPVQISLWSLKPAKQHLTRSQCVWAFGVIDFGIGMFLFNFGWDVLEQVLPGKHADLTMSGLAIMFALCIFGGAIMGFWTAPSIMGNSPVISIDLLRKGN